MRKKTSSTAMLALELETLRRLAGARSFGRGEEYFASGRVVTLIERGATIRADVRGSRTYHAGSCGWKASSSIIRVPVRSGRGDGEFCKHAVAVGLAELAGPEPALADKRRRRAVSEGTAPILPQGARMNSWHCFSIMPRTMSLCVGA